MRMSPYDIALIRAKKRIEHNYAVEAGLDPAEKQAEETEAEFRKRIRNVLMDASGELRVQMRQDKRYEYTMLKQEYGNDSEHSL